MWKFIKEMFTPKNEIITKSFNDQLYETIDTAEKVITLILCSNLPKKDRLQIADKIMYLVCEIRELETIKNKEIDRICHHLYITKSFGSF